MIARLLFLILLLVLGACGSTAGVDDAFQSSQSNVDCSAEGLGEDDEFTFISAYEIVDGQIGDACFGEDNGTLVAAWNELATITPQEQLADLALFAGFSGDDSAEEETLAFVNVIDDDGLEFQMSVNLSSYLADENEASLTIAHEFAHVFTSIEGQIDRTVFDAEACATYYNGEGCFLEDSIMAQWVELFWGDGLIDEIDPNEEPSNADGEDRCDRNSGFLGPYAASNPEEDFAETFSAYVFQLEADTAAQQAKIDWIDDQAGLAEFRQRAVDAGVGPLRNNFETCG